MSWEREGRLLTCDLAADLVTEPYRVYRLVRVPGSGIYLERRRADLGAWERVVAQSRERHAARNGEVLIMADGDRLFWPDSITDELGDIMIAESREP